MRTNPIPSSLLSLLLTALLACSGLAEAQRFSSLEERMSDAEFRAAGLDTLSAAQLAALNQWLTERGLVGADASAPPADASDRVGLAPERGQSDRVSSRLMGSFRGWTGSTEFQLQNGQVWRQTGGGELAGVSLEEPEVTIEQGIFGTWYLRVEGYNSRAKVKRVR
jgi:hypothetical protein